MKEAIQKAIEGGYKQKCLMKGRMCQCSYIEECIHQETVFVCGSRIGCHAVIDENLILLDY